MQAFETKGRIDAKGNLHIEHQLNLRDKNVKVLILYPDDDSINEQQWLKSLSGNPAFDFLKNEEEDIYTIKDGIPFNLNEI